MVFIKKIFEDEWLIVIEKPTGLVVNRAATVSSPVLQDWIEEQIDLEKYRHTDSSREFVLRSGLVHRLDKPTSGLLVIAKNPQTFSALQKQFKARTITKKYLALVHGRLNPSQGDIAAPIKRNPFNRMRFGVFVDGRPSITRYKVLDYYQNPKETNRSKKYFSFVEVRPLTGRTHQIRVHFSHLHYPLVSDALYAGKKTARADLNWCPRLFLHASNLEFNHPSTKERVKLASPLPQDLLLALQKREKVEIT